MSVKCSVRSDSCFVCKETNSRLYKIPKEKERLKKWMMILGCHELLEVDYGYLQRNAKICGSHFGDWAFTSTNRERLIRFALPGKKEPPSSNLFATSQEHTISDSNVVLQILGTKTDDQKATQNSNDDQKSTKNKLKYTLITGTKLHQMLQNSNKVNQTLNNNKVHKMIQKATKHTLKNSNETQQMLQTVIKGSNEVLQALQNSNEIQQTPQNNKEEQAFKTNIDVQQTIQNSNEVQKVPQNRNREEHAFKIGNEVQQFQQNSNEVQQAHQNSDEVQQAHQTCNEEQQAHQNSNEVQQAHQNSSEVQQAHQNSSEVQAHQNSSEVQAHQNSNEVQKSPQNTIKKEAFKIGKKGQQILQNSNEAQQTSQNSNEVQQTSQNSNEVKKRKLEQYFKQRNEEKRRIEVLQEESRNKLERYLKHKKEVLQEESRNKLEQYLKHRKEMLQTIQKRNRGLQSRNKVPQSRNKVPQSLQNRNKGRQWTLPNSNVVQQTAQNSEEEQQAFPVIKVIDTVYTTPSYTTRLPYDADKASRLIKNQRSAISKLKKKVEKLKNKKFNFVQDLKDQMNPEQYGFVMSQIQQSKRGKAGRRWSKEDKVFALRIYLQSPDAYRILLEKLSFPGISTLKKYSRKLGLT